jgi:L-aspartate oxidase
MQPQTKSSDFLVIGSGIAGLSFAIKASEYGTVNIVTKKKNFDSSTNYAQGGIASVLAPGDSLNDHAEDTIKAGAGLCNKKAVQVLVESGPERINELIEWGTRFTYKEDGSGQPVLDLGREGGHSRNRIVHSYDLTGQELERSLLAKINSIENINIYEDHTAVDLLTEHQLKLRKVKKSDTSGVTCYGAYVLENRTGVIHTYNAKLTMIASGGAGHVYMHTTNPDIATGDGIAIAFRAGALIADMEFMQFHPTSLYEKEKKNRAMLISEAVRGEGAVLVNSKGERFMQGVHSLKDLAPRDIVARAIDRELKKSGEPCVFLDITFKDEDFLKKRFPFIYENCLKRGINIAEDLIPVVPAAHYLCGGIVTDLNGKTSINNLYAAGEAACTGVHGANRLASNSLLEAVVFADQAARHAVTLLEKDRDKIKLPECPPWNKEGTFDQEEWVLIQHDLNELKACLWDYVGIVRSNLRLERAYRRIIFLEKEILDYYKRRTLSSELVELRNLATVARLIIQSAMQRKESRGLHFNTDYPEKSKEMEFSVIQSEGDKTELKNLETINFK